MERDTTIFGAYTGGGWSRDPEDDDAHVYYAVGRLSGYDLTINGVHRCDGREGLLWVILDSRGPWGLDFPFSLPVWTYPTFSKRDWPALLKFAKAFDRAEVEDFMRAAELDDLEGECRHPGDACRVTDAEAGALSPIKRDLPDRLRTTHAGLRLLSRLRGHGASVYPFDHPRRARQRLYEVYPANTYARLGLGDAFGPRDFVAAFNAWEERAVDLSVRWEALPVGYALDSLVSCVTLANAIRASDLDARWNEMPAFVTALEWEVRMKEA